jgi:hypothetical protein
MSRTKVRDFNGKINMITYIFRAMFCYRIKTAVYFRARNAEMSLLRCMLLALTGKEKMVILRAMESGRRNP